MSEKKENRINNIFNVFNHPVDTLDKKDFTVEDAVFVCEELSHVGIRDAVLYKFLELNADEQVEYLKSVFKVLEFYCSLIEDDSLLIAASTFAVAIDYSNVGYSVHNKIIDDKDLKFRLNQIDTMIEYLLEKGNVPSLLRLMNRARQFDVPDYVFYESIKAVDWKEILDSVPPVEDKENTDDNNVVRS